MAVVVTFQSPMGAQAVFLRRFGTLEGWELGSAAFSVFSPVGRLLREPFGLDPRFPFETLGLEPLAALEGFDLGVEPLAPFSLFLFLFLLDFEEGATKFKSLTSCLRGQV